jgi:FG-GAP repeat
MSSSPLLSIAIACIGAPLFAQVGGQWTSTDGGSGTEVRSKYGHALCYLDDLTGDSVAEILVGAPFATNGLQGTVDGYAEIRDGVTMAILRTHEGISEPGGKLGTAVARMSDIDGDGVDDYAISEIHGTGNQYRTGLVHAYSGMTGAELWVTEGDQSWAGFGTKIVNTGDLTGDGIADLAVSTPDWNKAFFNYSWGAVHLISGADGSHVHRAFGTGDYDYFGQNIGMLGDVDGDGVNDLGVARRGTRFDSPGYLRVYSGANFHLLEELAGPPVPMYGTTGFAHSFCSLGDLDGDGADEFAIGLPYYDNDPWRRSGAVRAYRGRTAEVLWTVQGANNYDYFGFALAPAGDLDGDGVQDLVVSEPNLFPGGAVHLLSGADGRRLAAWIETEYTDDYGLTIVAGEDITGDGIPEILVGALEDDVFSNGPGRFDVLSWDPLLRADARVASNSAGGSLRLQAKFPASEAGMTYSMLLSGTGIGPTPLGGVLVPLSSDQLLARTRRGNPPSDFLNANGSLDASALAEIDFVWSPGRFIGELGRSYWACVVTTDLNGIREVSASVPLTITP